MTTDITLKGGVKTADRRLDRLAEFDPQSRNFPVRAVIAVSKPTRGRTWPLAQRLDQGSEGACTGFARAHDLAASPVRVKGVSNEFARKIYKLAQTLDEWEGEDYSGSSVLGAVKAAQQLGFVGEYRWAFGIDDVILALAELGPVVLGTDWLDSMFDTLPNGLLIADGEYSGGHSYILRGVAFSRDTIRRKLGKGQPIRKGEALITGTNSWGRSWGRDGNFYIWESDVDKLLRGVKYAGEAAVTSIAFRGRVS